MLFKAMGYFEISVGKIVLFLTTLLLALLLNFALYFCIGISGLWLTEISRLFPALTRQGFSRRESRGKKH
jgi:hypothetical protein